MRFSLLGPLEVLDDANDPVELGGRQPRTMLAVSLWEGNVCPAASSSLRSCG